jgi:hypothetical protein
MWSPQQRQRLALEHRVLARKMPQFQFCDPRGNTYVEGTPLLSSGTSRYRLRVDIPADFPLSYPSMYVSHPTPLWKHGGREKIDPRQCSHAFHMLSNDNNDWIKICYTGSWSPSMSLFAVLLRGILWLEAYEAHLRTGRNLADFLCT